MKTLLLAGLLLALPVPSFALTKCVTADGKVEYTDGACANYKIVKQATEVKVTKPDFGNRTANGSAPAESPYLRIERERKEQEFREKQLKLQEQALKLQEEKQKAEARRRAIDAYNANRPRQTICNNTYSGAVCTTY